MRRHLAPVALAALLVLAGCAGAFGGDGLELDTSTDSQTGERVAAADAALPPGVTESGVSNATALVAAHDETLRAEGFALNGTLARNHSTSQHERREYDVVVAPGADRFRADVQTTLYTTATDPDEVVQRRVTSLWSDGTAIRRQTTFGDETVRTRIDAVPTSLALTRGPQYRSYLDVGEYEVQRAVRRGGHTYTTLVANGTTAAAGPDSVTVSGQFVVDERGVVHEADVTLRSGTGSDSVTDRATYRLLGLGGSPERPRWADNETSE